MSSSSDRVVIPRKGLLEIVLRDDNAEGRDRGDEVEEADADIDESSLSGVVPLDTDLDDAEEAEEDVGCILTRIFPSSEGAVSNEMSKSPRLCRPVSPPSESIPVNSSFLVPELTLVSSPSKSTNELDLEYDQSNSLGANMLLSKSKSNAERPPEAWKVLDTANKSSIFVVEAGVMDNKEGNAHSRTWNLG
jgi:hypothetical protein